MASNLDAELKAADMIAKLSAPGARWGGAILKGMLSGAGAVGGGEVMAGIIVQAGAWGPAAIGVQLMVMSYQLSQIKDKVDKTYDELKAFRAEFQSFEKEIKGFMETVVGTNTRQETMLQRRAEIDAIYQLASIDIGTMPEQTLAQKLIAMCEDMLGGGAAASITSQGVPYMKLIADYVKKVRTIDDQPGERDMNRAYAKVAQNYLSVHCVFMDLVLTLQHGLELLMQKAVWYGGKEGVEKLGGSKKAASDKQKVLAREVQWIVAKVLDIVLHHDPFLQDDIKHHVQMSFLTPKLTKLALLVSFKESKYHVGGSLVILRETLCDV